MPGTTSSTAAGDVSALEAPTVAVLQLTDELMRRETTRIAAPSTDDIAAAELHLDIYPAPTDTGRVGTVVFVGGLSAHALMYSGFLDALSRRGYDVVALDVRGHGRSGGRRGDFTAQSTVADLQAAVDYARERFGGPLALMGSSLGGFYALVGANAVRGIDLGVSHWIFMPDQPVKPKDARVRPVAITLAKVVPWLRINTKLVADWHHVNVDPELRRRIFDDPLMTWKYTMRALASGFTYEPERPLTELQVPHLVLIGEEDQMTPLPYTKKVYEQLIGDKELVIVPGAGHMGGLIEQRDLALAAVDGWLKKRLPEVAVAP